ncbi:antitoxin Xre/MbcA/ParS toxin-binding domain-containing protein [Solidesulfovibrio sp. C21]|uniref:antitoxin Xre/MbcA/ParS toxin-binding domain-containing protein n=1 Tax=Solidesulfovibrio sp. C21 TaxID=3398613 RepID=UPI0039FCE244
MPVHPKRKQSVSSRSGKQLARAWAKREALSEAFALCERRGLCLSGSYSSTRIKYTVSSTFPPQILQKRPLDSAIYTENFEDISLIADIIKRATEVFGNTKKAQQWLSKPLAIFQKKSPLQYAETKEGADFVLDVLGRIEYGVFS